MKVLRMHVSDGSLWDVDWTVLKKAYKESYRDHEEWEDGDEDRIDDYSIHDHAIGNLDWDDVKAHARMVIPPTRDMGDEWLSCYKEVVNT